MIERCQYRQCGKLAFGRLHFSGELQVLDREELKPYWEIYSGTGAWLCEKHANAFIGIVGDIASGAWGKKLHDVPASRKTEYRESSV